MLLALVGILYPYVSSVEMVVLLRILQGALFGIVLMATGSTLAIDVTIVMRQTVYLPGVALSGC